MAGLDDPGLDGLWAEMIHQAAVASEHEERVERREEMAALVDQVATLMDQAEQAQDAGVWDTVGALLGRLDVLVAPSATSRPAARHWSAR
jgi:hypothetical protein